jgi:hypothetical protein
MSLSLEQAQAMNIDELAGVPASDLMSVQAEVANYLRHAKEFKDWIDGAIAMKYDPKVSELRTQLDKDTGTVNFEDDGVRVSSDLPKKTVWD